MDWVPHIFGFALKPGTKLKPGTNIFVAYRAKRCDTDMLDQYLEARDAGKTSAQADKAITEKFGKKEHSVIQKRKARARKLRERIIEGVKKTTAE